MQLITGLSLFLLCVSLAQTKHTVKRRMVENENDPYRVKYLMHLSNGKVHFEFITEKSKGAKITPTEEHVTFRLTNRANIDTFELLHCNNFEEIISSKIYNANLPNYFITHGWSNSGDSDVNLFIRKALLEYTDANVFVVDWSSIAGQIYTEAQGSVPVIGKFIGEYINKMLGQFNLTPSDFSLVGHSLGAHVSGCAGANVKEKVKYIIGLDPAGPLFTIDQTDNRLDETDAQFVQIIHTNTGLLSFASSIGHVDFYPNGGEWQPGCGIDITGACAHNRAFEFLAESIGSSGFLATSCGSYEEFLQGLCTGNDQVYMGQFEVDVNAVGDYYLSTNSLPPYAQN